MRGRRVGTFTLGLLLIAVGGLYLAWQLIPNQMDLLFLVRFWPIALISLGCEVMLSYWKNKEDKLRYDGGAIFLSLCVIGLAWGMAAFEMALRYGEWHDGYWYF